ncbi:nitroreductase [Sphaerisporangium krabiense]|uniref:Nitroreductase n=1 Tax=Sphaerisporangium krabiense TaxID=763782 RepID=A0A7W9DUC8_9ACTN|nr:nitroreductase family protein [Sphaerisporangium krabiense]MBB5631626.1 nitroreductase [Sphaerisporangium krabiense]GII61040.1 nitroreductase [Sphaerisporangium krabiense]
MPYPTATDLGVRRLLCAAGQAPSVHNTQPWRFRVAREGAVELLADPARRLVRSDPRGRSLHVSCGAALFNLRLAVRVAGYQTFTRPLPAEGGSRLLAVVRPGPAAAPTPAELELYAGIGRRRTNREPYEDRPLPPAVVADLRVAASREGAALVPLGGYAATELLDLVAAAEDELAADHAYQAELRTWTTRESHHDGMPARVLGPRPAGDLPPTRDFGAHAAGSRARFEPRPRLMVLTTRGDRPADWLRAGQALQRVLLVACAHGVSVSFLNQPLDLRDMRLRGDPGHRRGHAQMILRLGYGPAVPRAPRRPPAELMAGVRENPPARGFRLLPPARARG